MPKGLRTVEIRTEEDVVRVRQVAKKISMLLGFENQDQVRIATAVSEIGRNALKYAGGGRAEYRLSDQDEPGVYEIVISDRGRGITRLKEVMGGTYRSESGMGLGIIGAQRLMDRFDIASTESGTTITLAKRLPRTFHSSPKVLAKIADDLVKIPEDTPLTELVNQNRELLRALQDLEVSQQQLLVLNSELEETNKGVVALYSELDDKSRFLQKASEVKSRFLSNMSHEFRTPVISIIALARLLLARNDGDVTKEQEKQITYILRAAESLQEMVNDLLDLAKIEAGKVSLNLTEFVVPDLFGVLRGMLRPLIPVDVPVNLVFDHETELPVIRSDEGKVAQILRNLISNALKYTQEGEVRVTARQIETGEVVFAVSDTGLGIDPKHLDLIFEEFVQVEGPHQTRSKGTGLGLPLTRKLAELLNGRILVHSELGKGSVFTFVLPPNYVAPRSDENLVKKDAPSVLVIDDDEISRYLLNDILKSTGFQLLQAANGPEGITLAKLKQPKAIFLDLIMPDMDGFEVLEELKKDPATRDIPVIVNSTRPIEQKEEPALKLQTVGILRKDFSSKEEASRVIRETLERFL